MKRRQPRILKADSRGTARQSAFVERGGFSIYHHLSMRFGYWKEKLKKGNLAFIF